jgi:DNA modification methylase
MAEAWRSRIVGQGSVAPETLQPHPGNPRQHPTAQLEALAGVLTEVGWVQDVIVNQRTGHILDGHARVELAVARHEAEVPVVYVDLEEAEESVVLASLDPLSGMALVDQGKLDALLAQVSVKDEALNAFLESLKSPPLPRVDPGPQVDHAAELQAKWQTARGQLWEIGRHRVLCGDATSAEDVGRVLDGAVPFLCVTDPPYGVEYDPNWRNVEAAKGNLAYAARRIGAVANDDRADWREAWALFSGDVIYSWHPPGATSLVHAAALQDSGFMIRMQIIWAKSNFPIGRGDYHVRHEPCWYAVRKGKAAQRTDDRTQTTLWEINLDRNVEGGHSTQKPMECMARPIRNHEAAEVYDPFLGSGTTAVAAEQLGRRCYGLEIEPKYVAVILERLSGMGIAPRLVS